MHRARRPSWSSARRGFPFGKLVPRAGERGTRVGERGTLVPRWGRVTPRVRSHLAAPLGPERIPNRCCSHRDVGRIGGLTSPARRAGFTLVELLVALSIFVVLTIMTIGAINLSVTSERVRGAARQVQAMLAGARDRAIFNSRTNPTDPRPVGVRLLLDENEPTICTSMVYIESAGYDTGNLVIDADGILRRAGTGWQNLSARGLIGPGSTIKVGRTGGVGEVELAIHPAIFPLTGEQLATVQLHPDTPSAGSTSLPLRYSIELGADVMADEDPLALPPGTCIDLENSVLPAGLAANRLDIMFSAKGTVVGKSAATGLIHLHLVTIEDALENTPPGSPTTLTDFDGDGAPDERHGEELGITIFTKSGRAISHLIAPYPSSWTPNFAYKLGDRVAASNTPGGPLFFEAIDVSGSSGGSEPGWNFTPSSLTNDGGVRWRAVPHDPWEFGLQGEVAR